LKLNLLLASSNSGDEDNSRDNDSIEGSPQGNNSEQSSDRGGPSNPQLGGPSNPQLGGPSNPQGNNLEGAIQHRTPSERSDEDIGYCTDSSGGRIPVNSETLRTWDTVPLHHIPEAELRQLAQESANDYRNADQGSLRASYFSHLLDQKQASHQKYTNEIQRRKDEGTIVHSPDREYDMDRKGKSVAKTAPENIPSFQEGFNNIKDPSAETSAAGSSRYTINPLSEGSSSNTVNPSAESSGVQPSASANPINPSGEGVNPSPRPGFWETILRGDSPRRNPNEDSTVDAANNTNNNEQTAKTTPKPGTAESSNEIKSQEAGNNPESSKRKFEEEKGESSSQPSKKFKQDSSDINSDTEPFDIGGGDD
jgi:hypothetical protein